MRVTLTGVTGFIGARLAAELTSAGHELRVLGRRRPPQLPQSTEFFSWDSSLGEPPAESLEGSDAVVNLAGEPVAQRWNAEVKRRIRDSRVDGTRHLVNALSTLSRRPRTLINASAIGIYGSRGDEILTESSSHGDDFLAGVTEDWEGAADLAEALGIRVVKLRIGIVLGKEGGALAKMLTPFRFGVGGRLGSGKQWMSWIHVEDVIRLILFAIENPAVRGPLNVAAPNPATNAEFTRQLAAALHRPAIFPVPAFALGIVFGEMAGVLISSQRALPQSALAAGFRFQHPDLPEALAAILR
jgi:uncharacterized protein (TIGR01777 family)